MYFGFIIAIWYLFNTTSLNHSSFQLRDVWRDAVASAGCPARIIMCAQVGHCGICIGLFLVNSFIPFLFVKASPSMFLSPAGSRAVHCVGAIGDEGLLPDLQTVRPRGEAAALRSLRPRIPHLLLQGTFALYLAGGRGCPFFFTMPWLIVWF